MTFESVENMSLCHAKILKILLMDHRGCELLNANSRGQIKGQILTHRWKLGSKNPYEIMKVFKEQAFPSSLMRSLY